MKQLPLHLLTSLTTLVAAGQLHSATLATRFATDPLAVGWEAYGNTNLFTWDSTNGNLRVTWDSAQPNSYFAQPLGQTLSRSNDFLVTFEVNLDDIAVGASPGMSNTFQIAVGLLHHSQLTDTNLARGSGYAPNIVEFDYFPNDFNNYGASISTALISSEGNYWSGGFTFPLEMATGAVYRVQMIFTAADQTLRSTMTSNGVSTGPLANAIIGPDFGDFSLDTVAISSYSEQGQYPGYEGSILAHGTVDNVAVAAPLPVSLLTVPAIGQVEFLSDTNWQYTLEASTNLVSWSAAASSAPGNGSILTLQDANPPTNAGFYRVQAVLP